MKKFLALSFAALAIASCNFNTNPDEEISYTSKYCIMSDLNGHNILKTEFVESTRAKETVIEYIFVDANWAFKDKVVAERTFDSFGNVISIKSSYYDSSDKLMDVAQARYEYEYFGNRPSSCNVFEEVGEDWVNTEYRIYNYDFGNDLVSSIDTYDLIIFGDELPYTRDEYAYSNGMLSANTRYVIEESSKKWNTLYLSTYTYDSYGRLITRRIEYPSAASSSSLITYYY